MTGTPRKYKETVEVNGHLLKAEMSAVRLRWKCVHCGRTAYHSSEFSKVECDGEEYEHF